MIVITKVKAFTEKNKILHTILYNNIKNILISAEVKEIQELYFFQDIVAINNILRSILSTGSFCTFYIKIFKNKLLSIINKLGNELLFSHESYFEEIEKNKIMKQLQKNYFIIFMEMSNLDETKNMFEIKNINEYINDYLNQKILSPLNSPLNSYASTSSQITVVPMTPPNAQNVSFLEPQNDTKKLIEEKEPEIVLTHFCNCVLCNSLAQHSVQITMKKSFLKNKIVPIVEEEEISRDTEMKREQVKKEMLEKTPQSTAASNKCNFCDIM